MKSPDFLVNNAAAFHPRAPLYETTNAAFSEMIDTNIKGVANVTRYFVPQMIAEQCGVIVNITSRWGRAIDERMAPYCATKWALVALTRILALELKKHRVAAVGLNPGIVNTRMLRRYLRGCHDKIIAFPSPESWAKSAAPFILGLTLKDSGRIRSLPTPTE